MRNPTVGAGADRVLYVLATLARHDGPLSIAALAEKTGLAQSTLYRQVGLLKRWGFVAEHEGEYGPGPLCVQLAWGFDQSSFLVHEAQPDMNALAASSGETVGLLVAVKDQAVCLDMVESQHPLRCSFVKGRGLPLVRGASAKSLMAFMPAARRQAALDAIAADTGADTEALAAELDAIRARGYAVTDGEVDAGVWGVSVPVFQRANQAVASITLMAPSTRAAQRPDALIDQTVAAARRISARLQSH
ncbi:MULTISPECIES: IclR family transcriptional regulator [unclassified Achromobacter]|uniref:IclR family transcriptional regulator n=1 Tax=unclassified Achromobacter TaxID=2626865 RepID=UPI00069E2A45|nr:MULTISPECIES: IclR family transcriptional regulator [unclassified Achromobacter]KOF53668.1 IclR family transcriptional regulator [Achromobacter sp. DMS1]